MAGFKTSVRLMVALELASSLTSPLAFSKNSAGLEYTGARHYSGAELNGSVDFNDAKSWTGDLSYGHVNSSIGGDLSTTNLFALGATNSPDDSNEGHGAIDFWNDSANHIRYVGPTGGYTHTWFGDVAEDQTVPELFALALNADLFFYNADVDQTLTGTTVRRGGLKPTITRPGTVRTTQFHPSFNVERPFFEGILVPYVTGGHYFYTRNPADLENSLNRANVHLSAASTIGLSSLVGGFLENNFALGTEYHFIASTLVRIEFGREQSATDHSWSTEYSVKFERQFGDRFKALLGWNHVVQQGVPIDFGVAGLNYQF